MHWTYGTGVLAEQVRGIGQGNVCVMVEVVVAVAVVFDSNVNTTAAAILC